MNSRVEAAQQSLASSGIQMERQVQRGDGVWMIVGHPATQPVDSGSIIIELKESGSEDTTVGLHSRRSSDRSVQPMRSLAWTLFTAIGSRLAQKVRLHRQALSST